MILTDTNGLGRIDLRTVPLPKAVGLLTDGTYTWSGKVLLTYRNPGDPQKDFYRLAVIDDDGQNFRPFFAGEIPLIPGANGIRFMCYPDNTRILLGDYVLECSPNMDECTQTTLVPIRYPDTDVDAARGKMRWSEIVIAPDNRHMCWTALGGVASATVAVAELKRAADCYELENIRRLSSDMAFPADPLHEGCVVPVLMRGGEVKQFIRGGTALSLVGMGKGTMLGDSVIQALDGEDVLRVTRTPCYDETTIFSPDERYGVVMSTRFSPQTNCAALGLLPRPYAMLSMGGLTLPIYMYAVASVREGGSGNIGPAMIDIERSMTEEDYLGASLNDPDNGWVYCSPISWHPGSRKAMWNERERGSGLGVKSGRLRVAEILDDLPTMPLADRGVPANIPYAAPLGEGEGNRMTLPLSLKIAGQHSGTFSVCQEGETRVSRYEGFSDDGQVFLDGVERTTLGGQRTVYEAELAMTGSRQGETNLRVTFTQESAWSSAHLDFSMQPDGKPASFGYASYEGRRADVEAMLP